jgi:hypothetical protein
VATLVDVTGLVIYFSVAASRPIEPAWRYIAGWTINVLG